MADQMPNHIGRLASGDQHGNVVMPEAVGREVIYLGSFENALPRSDVEIQRFALGGTGDYVGVAF
jgi:hypothetical protein